MQPELFHGPLPIIAAKYSGKCLVVGPGWTLKDDLTKWDGIGDVMAVNASGCCIPQFQHWFTMHPENLVTWRQARETPVSCHVHTNQGKTTTDGSFLHIWPINGHFAAWSGEGAAVVAVALGYDEIILAGIPADGAGYTVPNPTGEAHADYGEAYSIKRWEWLRDNYFNGRVRSLSGNTKDMLG